ncbi:MAG: SCP2 sterol-binding domain-containing protein [Candidatus Binatia bacterium]
MPQAVTGTGAKIIGFFFMHVGTLIAVVVYFVLCESGGYAAGAVRSALLAALAVETAYLLLAAWQKEHKHFDFGLWAMFAVGAVAARAGLSPVFALYRDYSPAILFVTLGLSALVPPLLGLEPFTYYYARRQLPRWQVKTEALRDVSLVMTVFWAILFFAAAVSCAYSPRNPFFTFVLPNLLIFVLGVPAQAWLPPLYFKLSPPDLPRSSEPLIMGMPMSFRADAAEGAEARIQFHVTGAEPGTYWLRIAAGKCESFEGVTADADLTLHTPDTVWVGIVHGELDGARALADGLYRVEGDLVLLAKMREWFGGR